MFTPGDYKILGQLMLFPEIVLSLFLQWLLTQVVRLEERIMYELLVGFHSSTKNL
jgi:hypothetical protein